MQMNLQRDSHLLLTRGLDRSCMTFKFHSGNEKWLFDLNKLQARPLIIVTPINHKMYPSCCDIVVGSTVCLQSAYVIKPSK